LADNGNLMKAITIQYHKTQIGELLLGSFEEQLCLLDFRYRKMRAVIDKRIKDGLQAEFIEGNDLLLRAAKKQLNEYLHGKRQVFDLPLLMVGTDFQKNVWTALLEIPYGSTATYLQIAKKIDKEKAVRAVATANGANSMSVVIPCHRIIGSKGDLVGYAGGLHVKKHLLNLEKRQPLLQGLF
jgi:methylated-DNA-[protein]-cysteine S-methyltransferase